MAHVCDPLTIQIMSDENKNAVDRRKLLTGIGGAGIVGLAGCLGGDEPDENGAGGDDDAGDDSDDPTDLVVASGSEGSIGHSSATALQAMLSSESDILRLTAQTSGGQAANLRLYDEGQVDMSGFDNYNYVHAITSEGAFADQPVENIQYQAMTIATIHIYMVARADTDIETYSDLAGRDVWPLGPGFGTRAPTQAFFEEIGLWDEMEVSNMDAGDVPGALEEGRLDAIGAYGSNFQTLPGWLQEVDARTDLKLIRMDDEYVETLQGMASIGHESIEAYGWDQDIQADEQPDGMIDSWLFQMQFGLGTHVPEELGYELVKLTHEHNESVRNNYGSFPDYDENPDFATSALIDEYPVHPGAAEYYQEVDQWDDNLEIGTIE